MTVAAMGNSRYKVFSSRDYSGIRGRLDFRIGCFVSKVLPAGRKCRDSDEEQPDNDGSPAENSFYDFSSDHDLRLINGCTVKMIKLACKENSPLDEL